jgi:hypothetical protein
VSLRAGLDTKARGKLFASVEDRTPFAQSYILKSSTVLTELKARFSSVINAFSEMEAIKAFYK